MDVRIERKLLPLAKLKLISQRRMGAGLCQGKVCNLGILPPKVTLENHLQMIYDQGDTQMCTGCSWAQHLNMRERFLEVEFGSGTYVSPVWIYDQERLMERDRFGNHSELDLPDEGAIPGDGLIVIQRIGVVSERDLPTRLCCINVLPNKELYVEASKHKVSNGMDIRRSPQQRQIIKETLVKGFTISVGIIIYPSFMSNRTGKITMPSPREREIGGHEVLIIGYDESLKVYLCANSWGDKWGMAGWQSWKKKGLFTLPYLYMEQYGMYAGATL